MISGDSLTRPRHVKVASLENLEPRRLLAGGDFDPIFGSGGVVVDRGVRVFAYDANVMPGDKILVAGRAGGSNVSDEFMLRRYNADGSRDDSFGSGGEVQGTFTSQSTRI